MAFAFKSSVIGAAISLASVCAAPAAAEDGGIAFSGNVALTTDYLFRGISQSENSAAIQGGFDATYNLFYAGVWASNIDFTDFGLPASIETDVYAGIRPTLGPIGLDFGVIGYFYPNADEDAAGFGEMDYFEGYAKASVAPAEDLSLGAAFYYSPEFTLETGDAYYAELSGAFAVTPAIAVSAAVGYQDIDDVTGVFTSLVAPFPASVSDSYITYNVGVTYSVHGFGLDLRYVGTDIDDSDPFITELYTTEQNSEGRVVFTIKRAL